MPRPGRFTPRKTDPVQGAVCASGPVWLGQENLAPTGDRSPDRPARSVVAVPTTLSGPLDTIQYQNGLIRVYN